MSTPTPPKNIRYPRITALIAIILAAVNLRSVITAISPLIPEIQASTGMSGTMVGIIGTVPTAMFAVSAFVLPRIKERFTLSEMMLLALGLTAVGQLLRVVYPNEWLLLVGSLIALFAIGILNATMPLVVREYFPRHVPSMSLTFMMSSQIMLAAAPIVAVPMMDWAENMGLPGWQISLGSWGVLAAIAAVSWMSLLIRRGPNPINTAPEPNFHLPVWRTTIGVGLAFMFGSNSLVAYTMMTFIPQIFTDAGQTAQYGANMLAIFSALGIPVTIVGRGWQVVWPTSSPSSSCPRSSFLPRCWALLSPRSQRRGSGARSPPSVQSSSPWAWCSSISGHAPSRVPPHSPLSAKVWATPLPRSVPCSPAPRTRRPTPSSFPSR